MIDSFTCIKVLGRGGAPFVAQVASYSLSRICYPYICMGRDILQHLFLIEKTLGEGAYGKVVCCKDMSSGVRMTPSAKAIRVDSIEGPVVSLNLAQYIMVEMMAQ